MSKTLRISRIQASNAPEAFRLLPDTAAVGAIDQINWPAEFSHAPQTAFRAAHNGRMLFLQFHVDEEATLAQVATDNGEVWTDSAVEFFIALDESGYYNFEFTCIGKALLGFRQSRDSAVHASAEIMGLIQRESSLGSALFAERHIDGGWTLSVAIPVEAFFAHQLETLDGVTARGNFYKCGDKLSKPHFLSWAPITTEHPNFHQPAFFGTLVFE